MLNLVQGKLVNPIVGSGIGWVTDKLLENYQKEQMNQLNNYKKEIDIRKAELAAYRPANYSGAIPKLSGGPPYPKPSEGTIVNSGEIGARSDGAKPIYNRRATSNEVTNFSSIDYNKAPDTNLPWLTSGDLVLDSLSRKSGSMVGNDYSMVLLSSSLKQPIYVFENGKMLQSYGKSHGGKPITIGYNPTNQQYFSLSNKGSNNSGSIYDAISGSTQGKYSSDFLQSIACPISTSSGVPKPLPPPPPLPKPPSGASGGSAAGGQPLYSFNAAGSGEIALPLELLGKPTPQFSVPPDMPASNKPTAESTEFKWTEDGMAKLFAASQTKELFAIPTADTSSVTRQSMKLLGSTEVSGSSEITLPSKLLGKPTPQFSVPKDEQSSSLMVYNPGEWSAGGIVPNMDDYCLLLAEQWLTKFASESTGLQRNWALNTIKAIKQVQTTRSEESPSLSSYGEEVTRNRLTGKTGYLGEHVDALGNLIRWGTDYYGDRMAKGFPIGTSIVKGGLNLAGQSIMEATINAFGEQKVQDFVNWFHEKLSVLTPGQQTVTVYFGPAAALKLPRIALEASNVLKAGGKIFIKGATTATTEGIGSSKPLLAIEGTTSGIGEISATSGVSKISAGVGENALTKPTIQLEIKPTPSILSEIGDLGLVEVESNAIIQEIVGTNPMVSGTPSELAALYAKLASQEQGTVIAGVGHATAIKDINRLLKLMAGQNGLK